MMRTIDDMNIDRWRNPEGVSVPGDELRFLLVPDRVEAAICFYLAQKVHVYQDQMRGKPGEISVAMMITQGGLLPGILLYDHVVEGRPQGTPKIRFGTLGISGYQGPGERSAEMQVQQGISVPVRDRTVLIIDDLGDSGSTMKLASDHVMANGASSVLTLVPYMKPEAVQHFSADFSFGEVPQDTWIITPRERIETLMKRVPVWKQRGASEQECRRRLCDLIGYSTAEVNYYLPVAYDLG
ncbi:MAG: phosphoribosyltransferase family protein [Gammaproteobacteria bacterium]|nr:phosphoribosyltransferase family protein [Gammaproteobacteria bacterium]